MEDDLPIALSAIRLGANLMLALGHVYARADFDDLPGQRACDIDVSRRAETLLVGDLLRVTLRTMPKSRSKPMSCRAAWRTEDERLAQLLRHLPRTGLRVSAAVENVIGRQIVAGEKIDFVLGKHDRTPNGLTVRMAPEGFSTPATRLRTGCSTTELRQQRDRYMSDGQDWLAELRKQARRLRLRQPMAAHLLGDFLRRARELVSLLESQVIGRNWH